MLYIPWEACYLAPIIYPTKKEFAMSTKKPYSGRERRRVERRQLSDRRSMIRFELNKEPRRNILERRQYNVWDHHSMI